MTFYERYAQLCSERGFKPQEKRMTDAFGISSGTISAWKVGTAPRTELLCKVADFFNVSIDYLLGRTDARSVATSALKNTIDEQTMRGQNLPTYSEEAVGENHGESQDNISPLYEFAAEERFLVDIYRKVDIEGRARINQAVMNIYDEYVKQRKETAASVS